MATSTGNDKRKKKLVYSIYIIVVRFSNDKITNGYVYKLVENN